MKILQASFHFRSVGNGGATLVVAHVYCEPHRVVVEPVHSALEGTAAMAQLRRIVEESGADPYSNLIALCSQDWSFDVAPIH